MDKIIKVEFSASVGGGYVRKEIRNIEVGEKADQETIDGVLDEEWELWVNNILDKGIKIL